MSERDRLAELLERVTRERRSSAGEGDGDADGTESAAESAPVFGTRPRDVVSGGEWLPPERPGGARHRAERSGPRPLTLPEALRSVRLSVRPAAVVGVLLVVLVAGAILGVRWWRAEQASDPVPVASWQSQQLSASGGDEGAATSAPASGTAPGTPPTETGAAASTTSAPTGAPERLLVHVAGQVREPGVVTLEAGARVQDAVLEAGGLTEEADTSRVNLARAVTDGERIWVPRPGEEVPALVAEPSGGAGPAGGSGASDEGTADGAGVQVNLNSADQAALEELPGVGPVTAAAILQWRTDHGQFSSPDELLEVSGIGEATLEKLLPHVTL